MAYVAVSSATAHAPAKTETVVPLAGSSSPTPVQTVVQRNVPPTLAPVAIDTATPLAANGTGPSSSSYSRVSEIDDIGILNLRVLHSRISTLVAFQKLLLAYDTTIDDPRVQLSFQSLYPQDRVELSEAASAIALSGCVHPKERKGAEHAAVRDHLSFLNKELSLT